MFSLGSRSPGPASLHHVDSLFSLQAHLETPHEEGYSLHPGLATHPGPFIRLLPHILLSPKTASDEVILRGLSQASLQSEMSSQPREACRALGSRGRQTGHLHTRVHTDTRTASSSPGNPCVRKHGCPRPVLVLRNLFTPHRALSSLSPGTAYRSWMLTAKEKSGCEELCLRLNGGRQARGMCVE